MTREAIDYPREKTLRVLSGTKFAIGRYVRYTPCDWEYHSEYRAVDIYRAFTGNQARGLYRAAIDITDNYDEKGRTRVLYAVGSSLLEVKEAIRVTLKEEGRL